MKFTRLIDQAEKIVEKHEKGQPVKPARLDKLQQLLGEKVLRYEAKLAQTDNAQKRKKLETRLKVVNAQLKKSKLLSTR
jgi:heterodisulfide reductase subunit B